MITFRSENIPSITRDEAINFYCLGDAGVFTDDGLYEITVAERNELVSTEYCPGSVGIGYIDIDEILADEGLHQGRTREEIEEVYVAKYDEDLGGVVLSFDEEGYSLIVNVQG